MTPMPNGESRRNTSLSRSSTRERATGPRSATRQVAVAPVCTLVMVTTVPNLRVRLAQESDPNGLAYQLAPPAADPLTGRTATGTGREVTGFDDGVDWRAAGARGAAHARTPPHGRRGAGRGPTT